MNTSALKYLLPVMAICAISVTACSSDNGAGDAQATVDSIVTAKTTMLKLQMKRNNDSLINAMALARADSMMPQKTIAVSKTATPAKK